MSGRNATYLEKADKLRAFGFHVKLRKGRKQSPQLKSAVSRLYNQHAHFLNPTAGTSPAKFFRLSAAQRRVAVKTVSKKQLTPGGLWIQVPKGVKPRDYKISVDKHGVTEQTRGRQRDRIVALGARAVAMDPVKAFRLAVERERRRTGKKPKQAQLIVNGFQGKRVQSLKSMLYYLEHNPRFLEETDGMEEDDFEDTFQLKLIYGARNTSGRKAKTRTTRKGGKRR